MTARSLAGAQRKSCCERWGTDSARTLLCLWAQRAFAAARVSGCTIIHHQSRGRTDWHRGVAVKARLSSERRYRVCQSRHRKLSEVPLARNWSQTPANRPGAGPTPGLSGTTAVAQSIFVTQPPAVRGRARQRPAASGRPRKHVASVTAAMPIVRDAALVLVGGALALALQNAAQRRLRPAPTQAVRPLTTCPGHMIATQAAPHRCRQTTIESAYCLIAISQASCPTHSVFFPSTTRRNHHSQPAPARTAVRVLTDADVALAVPWPAAIDASAAAFLARAEVPLRHRARSVG